MKKMHHLETKIDTIGKQIEQMSCITNTNAIFTHQVMQSLRTLKKNEKKEFEQHSKRIEQMNFEYRQNYLKIKFNKQLLDQQLINFKFSNFCIYNLKINLKRKIKKLTN